MPGQRRHEIEHIGDVLVLDAREHDGRDQHAGHAAVERHAAIPDMKHVEPALGDHVMAVKNAPADAAADDDADGAVENEVVDVERGPGRAGLPRPVARQPPGGDEADEVHDPVPMHAQRAESEDGSDGDGDGIDVRIGQHGRYFKPSFTRQK